MFVYIYTQTFIYCQAQLPDTMWTRRPTPKSASQAGFFSCQAVFMCINIYIYMIIYIYNKLPRKTVPQRLQRHIVVHDDNECVCVCIYILHYNCIQIDPGSNGSKSSSLSSSWTNHPLRNVYQGGGPKCIKYIFCILSMNISIIAIVRL